MISFELRPLPTHMNAPDAWSVWQTTVSVNEDGDDVTGVEVVAWGLSLGDALDQIRLVRLPGCQLIAAVGAEK